MTWCMRRTPYVVLIHIFSLSSGLSRSVPHPVRLHQHSRACFPRRPTFSSSHLLTFPSSYFLTLSSSPLPTLPSSHFLHNHISLLYLFFLKIK